MSTSVAPALSLIVQVVLCEHTMRSQLRLAGAIGAAVSVARAHHTLDAVSLQVDDRSHWPTLPDDAATQLADAAGLDDVNIRFLGREADVNAEPVSLADRDGDLVWMLDPDAYPAPDALAWLIQALAQNAQVVAAESRQIPIDPRDADEFAPGDAGWMGGPSSLVRRSVIVGRDVDRASRRAVTRGHVVYEPHSVVVLDRPIEIGAHETSEGSHVG